MGEVGRRHGSLQEYYQCKDEKKMKLLAKFEKRDSKVDYPRKPSANNPNPIWIPTLGTSTIALGTTNLKSRLKP